jgi:hypothetical protein
MEPAPILGYWLKNSNNPRKVFLSSAEEVEGVLYVDSLPNSEAPGV